MSAEGKGQATFGFLATRMEFAIARERRYCCDEIDCRRMCGADVFFIQIEFARTSSWQWISLTDQ